ncbi:uncharacterized protein LOC126375036 [Pectinophora gossypiella]|uniref:uncharacterized protein LOC126375036 n=1 Tax=Pectinophora gossypiella TaxID=13191 RepID=UPI00214E8950|nr:uncharacterized protein LOC126375036 [Pectinophora gossypiella]
MANKKPLVELIDLKYTTPKNKPNKFNDDLGNETGRDSARFGEKTELPVDSTDPEAALFSSVDSGDCSSAVERPRKGKEKGGLTLDPIPLVLSGKNQRSKAHAPPRTYKAKAGGSLGDKEKGLSRQMKEPEGAAVSISESESDCSGMDTAISYSDGGSTAGGRRRAKRGAPEADSSGESCASYISVASTLKSSAKRGRGRPPTTGHYVGLARAKEDLIKAKQAEMDLDSEIEMASTLKSALKIPADSLQKRVENGVELILQVANKSKNLKGTYVRVLKVAADQIREAAAALQGRTASEETVALQAENAQLREQLEMLREEVARLRTDVEQVRTPTRSTEDRSVEEFKSSIMLDIGFMIDAKLKNLEGRLLPEKRMRPPLRSDPVPSTSRSSLPPPPVMAAPKQAKQTEPTQSSGAPAKKKKGKGPKKVTTPNPLPPPPPPSSTQNGETWATVVKRGGKKKKVASSPATQPAKSNSAPAKESTKLKPKPKKKVKLRPPRTAAVVITLQPEAVEQGLSYDKVLSSARDRIQLKDIGIAGLKFRQAVTGARVLEILGQENEEKADRLASKLKEVLPSSVRVARPTRCVDLRITGLDDSVTREDIAAAIAETGKCPSEQVKVGIIKDGLFGVGSVVVQCPVVAAKTLVDSGRLLVGWSSARVQSLEPRPMQCFRCLEIGHTGRQCQSTADRSQLCFRCCKPGHKSVDCTEGLHCPLCHEAGRPSGHAIGGRQCVRPKKKGHNTAARTPAGQPRKPPPRAMDTGN